MLSRTRFGSYESVQRLFCSRRNQVDTMGRNLGALAQVAYMRSTEATRAEESFRHLVNAIEVTKRALLILPSEFDDNRAVLHNKLAAYYSGLGSYQEALEHNRQAIAGFDACRMPFQGARARYLAAVILKRLHRYVDALEYATYARSILCGLATRDVGVAEVLRATENLLVELEQRT